jgi:phospholipase A1/A2
MACSVMHLRLPARAVLLLLILAPAVFAAGRSTLVYSTVAHRRPAAPGATVEFQLAVLNPTAGGAALPLPSNPTGHLMGAANRWTVKLQPGSGAEQARAAVAAGGFAIVPLSFTVPADAIGELVLELPQFESARVAVSVTAPATHAVKDLSATRAPASLMERRTAVSHVKNYFAGNFAPHEPLYFTYGPDAPAAKFQISFKYRLPLDDGWLVRRMPEMGGLHLAFTQRSLWDLDGQSSPFYDTSYMPELMYQFAMPVPERAGLFSWLGWNAGVQHESNGKQGADSRSLNVTYLRTSIAFGDLDGWHLLVIPRVFTYVGDRFDNPNIGDYRGWGDLRVVFGKNDGPAVSLHARAGRGFRHRAL